MTPLEILVGTRELLSEKFRWTQGSVARTVTGTAIVDAHSGIAVKWCAIGAMMRVAGKENWAARYDAQAILESCIGGAADGGLAVFNDDNRHEEVLKLLDKGITACRDR